MKYDYIYKLKCIIYITSDEIHLVEKTKMTNISNIDQQLITDYLDGKLVIPDSHLSDGEDTVKYHKIITLLDFALKTINDIYQIGSRLK
jgi:hypothetical protein